MKPEDLIKQAQNTGSVGFHKFVLLHGKFKTDLFIFFEGKDTHYYFPRVINTFGENHHPIICGNKKAVLETYNLVVPKYPSSKTAFFIDSDFDENPVREKIYTTPCYSIENLYCSSLVLSRILKNEFILSELDTEYKTVMELFRLNQNDFHNGVKLFNAWYAAAKSKAKESKTIVNASLNDKFPKEFVSIKIGNIQSHYNLEDIQNKFPEAIVVTQGEVDKSYEKFDVACPGKLYRGKYEIEFFTIFLRYIIDDANKGKTILKKKTKFSIDGAQILSQISQYSETPTCLINFIASFKN